MPTVNDILAVILGGGRGTRLYPLTRTRSKPAVPVAGKYRLIDIPISNCINSGIYHIAVLTQFNSVSLHRHIANSYNFDAFHPGWVQIWAAEQTMTSSSWYQGTADAVRKQLFQIRSARQPYVLILAGDHLYSMDYAAMARFHWEKGADITVATYPLPAEDAGRFGLVRMEADGRMVDFAEKPSEPEVLARLRTSDDPSRPYWGSMGIYLFNTGLLADLLETTQYEDFGSHVLPAAIQSYKVYGYPFRGYWQDIGTIRSFYETNLALASAHPPFNLFDSERPVYTHARFLPGSMVENSTLEDALLCEGSCISEAEIHHAVIGVRSVIGPGTRLVDSVLMGNDYYTPQPGDVNYGAAVPLGIGENCYIEGAIIDKNVHIGAGSVILPFPRGTEIDAKDWFVRDGIVVIPKDGLLPPGTQITPEAVAAKSMEGEV
jgi:glucose-1-phosphate adenylyltransferase